MSQEIVFTSARKGLRSGSTGFCTVRSTRGMPGNLAQLLERLTGYTHVFDAYGNEATLNPVNFAHYVARLGDQRFHVLARISNAPLDHTNRSNKLAHLLAIDSGQLEKEASEGPAAESMQLPWVKTWSSETEPFVLPDSKQILLPMPNQSRVSSCSAWKDATGDAGWAAVLASSAVDSKETMTVIVPRDIGHRDEFWSLQLVNEALSLLSPQNRWDVTYSTFFNGNLPVSIQCQWQFILDGTDLAKQVRLNPRARSIDIPAIATKRTPTPASELTALTVGANRPWDHTTSKSRTARRRPQATAEIPSSVPDIAPTSDIDDLTEQPDAEEIESQKTKRVEPAGRESMDPPEPFSFKVATPTFSDLRSSQDNLPLLLRPLSLVIYLAIFVLLVVLKREWSGPRDSGEFHEIVESANQTNSRDEKKKQQRQADNQKQAEDAARRQREQEVESRRLAQAEKVSVRPEAPISDAPAVHEPDKEVRNESPRQSPFQSVRVHENRLELTLPRSGLDASADRPIHLVKIHVTSPDDFNLIRIIGGRTVLGPNLDFSIEEKNRQGQSIRQWDVIRRATSQVGLGDKPHVVGTFRLNESFDLSFRWDKDNKSFEIVNCLLEMEAGEPGTKREREICTLREIKRLPLIGFDLDKSEQLVPLLGLNELANTEAVELHCDFRNLPGKVTRKGSEILHVGDSVRFEVQGERKDDYVPTAEISVAVIKTESAIQLNMKMDLELPDENFEKARASYTPGLMIRSAGKTKEFGARIDTDQRTLKSLRKTLADLRETFQQLDEKGRKAMTPDLKTAKEAVDARQKKIAEDSETLRKLNSFTSDMNNLLNDISTNAKLNFKLRVMIPDAIEGGVSLVETEE